MSGPTITDRHPSAPSRERAARIVRALWQWFLKRGILFVLTQTPMIALLVGYFYRWTTFSVASALTILPTLFLLPAYLHWRRRVSDDPEEPAHHFGRLALWALVPYVVYNLARVPAHYLLQIVFWDHWYDYGSELTGQPVDQWTSLNVGTVAHAVQGYVLALGFYILFKRVTLLTSLAYVWVFLSAVYVWHFPRYVLVDFKPPPKWFFLAIWAHFWMAIAAYFVPTLYGRQIKNALKAPVRGAILVLAVLLVYLSPMAFVYARVAAWQFPIQRTIDENVFDRTALVLHSGPTLDSVNPTARGLAQYRFTLRLGPRPYKDYIRAVKAVDAGPVHVTGAVRHKGEPIAFCFERLDAVETPNMITAPAKYFPTLTRMQYTDIAVTCQGASARAEAVQRSGDAVVDLEWNADVTLIGDRERTERTFAGSKQVTLVASRAGGADEPRRRIRPAPKTSSSELVLMILGSVYVLATAGMLWPSRGSATNDWSTRQAEAAVVLRATRLTVLQRLQLLNLTTSQSYGFLILLALIASSVTVALLGMAGTIDCCAPDLTLPGG